MKKYVIAALAVIALGAAIAFSQVVTFPPPAGMIGLVCKYDSAPVTLTSGQIGFVQCADSSAHLGSSGGGAGGNATIISPLGHTTADAAAVAMVPSATADFPSAGTVTSLATLHTDLGTLNTTAGSPLASQSPAVPIGGTGICDGANGTTNPCTTAATVLGASTAPAAANKSISVSLNPTSLSQGASVPISVSTATTTQLVAISGSTKIFVTSYDVVAGGTGNITFEYGTGSTCGTGTNALTGAYNLTAQAGISKGSGAGTVLFVPAGNALCVLTSANVQMSGSVSYIQY